MKSFKLYRTIFLALLTATVYSSCTKLNTPVYSNVESDKFWQTADQFTAGIAPVYTAMQGIVIWDNVELNEVSTDEIIIPTRGNDWYDNGNHQRIFLHTWTASDGPLNSAWSSIFTGIGRCNYTLNVVQNLKNVPSSVDINNVIAQIKVMRAYYYWLALDYFGNVPIVKDFNTDPSTVKNNSQQEVFSFIESELKTNIPLITPTVDVTTYGRATKWMAFATLAKLYLNAQVYTGTARWKDCAAACDSILLSGKYSLEPVYFDNFKPQNDNSKENIFVVPFDSKYISGNQKENQTLHYADLGAFGLLGNMYNGWASHGDFLYANFDTTAVYAASGSKIYRTYNDQRTGQFLVGNRFAELQSYPPSQNVLVSAPEGPVMSDGQAVAYKPNFTLLSDNTVPGKLTGARNIKYFPEAGSGNSINQSNDVVVFRLGDIILMRAEAIMRGASTGSTGSAVELVNQIRTRAYGNSAHNWSAANITPTNMLAERARELSWEGWRRQDLIRFDVADGTHYYDGARGGTRSPAKPADKGTYIRLFPIPDPQHSANANLVQNPGYPSF